MEPELNPDNQNSQQEVLIKLENELKLKEKELLEREEQFLKSEEQFLKAEAETIRLLIEREAILSELERNIHRSTSLETKLGKNQVVKLNVGGKEFVSTLLSLKRLENSYFTALFSDHFNSTPEENGTYFIDRPYEHFHLILNYLRGIDVKAKLQELKKAQLNDLIQEIMFYQLPSMYELLPQQGKLLLISYYGVSSEELPVFEFDLERCSKTLLLESPFRLTKVGKRGWNAHAMGKYPVSSFQIRLVSNCENLCVGFSMTVCNDSDERLHGKTNGTYFMKGGCGCGDGIFVSCNGQDQKIGYPIPFRNGSIVKGEIRNGTIYFSVNDFMFKSPYSNVPPAMYPTLEILDDNACIEIIPYKHCSR